MKAIFLYSEMTGQGRFLKNVPDIVSRLRKSFPELLVHKCLDEAEIASFSQKACLENYDSLIIAGGDGTFNDSLQAVMKEEHRPIMGYLNTGTLGDVGANFGVNKNIEKALSIIEKGRYSSFDIVKVNDSYFAYMAAIGAYSDISYLTKREKKKRLGKVAYYNKAIGEAFKKNEVEAIIMVDDKTIKVNTPFILLLNGRKVGGFAVNRYSSMKDGKIELYLTEPGFFNGLLHYVFKKHLKRIQGTSFHIHSDIEMPWCLDGEKGPVGDIDVTCLPLALKVYCK